MLSCKRYRIYQSEFAAYLEATGQLVVDETLNLNLIA